MEMKLIEVALSLVVVYLVLALVATQIGELVAGGWGSRRRNLQDMIKEVFPGQGSMAKDFFAYGPIAALSRNSSPPSAIPADLFASSFLAVLNKNSPPRLTFRTPAEFTGSLTLPKEMDQIVKTHLAGSEVNWDTFEAALARWYSDIGDRADGWYRKKSSMRLVIISVLLSVAVNADTANIARTLFEDDELRISTANIGELIANEVTRTKATGAASAPAAAPLPPASEFVRATQASAELDAAYAGVRAAFDGDARVKAFGSNYRDLSKDCSTDINRESAWYASNSDAWLVLIPSIQNLLAEARFGASFDLRQERPAQTGSIAASAPVMNSPGSSASQAKAADMLPRVASGALEMDQRARTAQLRRVLACTAAISVWIKASRADSQVEKAKTGLANAAAALERAQNILADQINRAAGQGGLLKRFAANSASFVSCAEDAGSSRAEFDQCLSSGGSATRIPLGWPARAGQFCKISTTTAKPAASTNMTSLFGCDDFGGNANIGLPSITANFDWGKFLASVAGILLTAVLVSLGAPFWFGILGKVANIRIAGRVRGLGESQLPTVVSNAATPQAPLAPSAGTGSDASVPFDDARNEFERGLRPQDITRLQKALGVAPSARLDQVTRNALSAKLKALGEAGDEELGSVSYEAIVGRRASTTTSVETVTGRWARGQNAPDSVAKLCDALNRIFPSPLWPALAPSATFSDDIRARVVLYRYRLDDGKQDQLRTIIEPARKANGELTFLDESLRQAILGDQRNVFVRDVPPWLDDAAGELGITENGAEAQSDPRVIEYLQSLGVAPIQGDQTPWCGAFVGWVMDRSGKLVGVANRSDLLTAAKWAPFGVDSSATPRRGDICVVENSGNHHVAFWIGQDASRVWLLGGNQGPTGSGAVTMVAFRLGDAAYKIVAIRRPT